MTTTPKAIEELTAICESCENPTNNEFYTYDARRRENGFSAWAPISLCDECASKRDDLES